MMATRTFFECVMMLFPFMKYPGISIHWEMDSVVGTIVHPTSRSGVAAHRGTHLSYRNVYTVKIIPVSQRKQIYQCDDRWKLFTLDKSAKIRTSKARDFTENVNNEMLLDRPLKTM